jgi:hypothetical protein
MKVLLYKDKPARVLAWHKVIQGTGGLTPPVINLITRRR